MKILIYTHEFIPYSAGVATYNYELAKGLSELGQEVIVLAPKYSNKDVELDKKLPFMVFRTSLPIESTMKLNKNIFRLPIAAYKFIDFIRRINPDKILITSAVAHESTALARLLFSFKFSLTVFGSEIFMHFAGKRITYSIKKLLMKRLFYKAEKIICISSYTKSLLNEHIKLKKEKIPVIRIGIDFNDLEVHLNKNKTEEINKKLMLSGNKVLLTVARLTPRKGHDIVIKAIQKVIKTIPEIKYIIVGKGHYLQSLEKIIKEKQLSNKVIFTGDVSREELLAYYELCDVFIMVSRKVGLTVEGLGISFLEAMFFSKPLIGGNHGGVKEVIENGENGLLVDPLNVNEVSKAICLLLTNSELAKSMGEAGRKRLESEFSLNVMAKRTLDLL